MTQWREYSPAGGIAIGVDFKELHRRAQDGEFAIAKMLYAEDRQREIICLTINSGRKLFQRIQTVVKTTPEPEGKQLFDNFMAEVGIFLLKSIIMFKHPAFSSEDEWRIFTLTPDRERDFRFRTRGNAIIPYVELKFTPSLISHIRCSPGRWSGSALYGVRKLAQSLGSHVQVSLSKLPL